ncbi:MAG TPA: DUF2059 domain-containing protein [Thermoanaerobaculia bacterium]|jgi:hypothetical protein
MRTIAAVLILAALPALATQPNPSAKQKELIDQLITLTHLDENVRYLLDAMLERMTKASNERRSEDDRKDLERYRQLVREKIDYGEWVRGVYEPLYAKYFTEAQLADLVAFYKTPTGQQMIKALPEIEREAMQTAGAQIREKFAALARQVDEERRARLPWEQTMADMRAVSTAAESWAVDHDGRYPPSQTWAELQKELEPTYLEAMPMKDGWGNELAYVVSEDRKHYRVISAGSDNAFDWDSRRIVVKEPPKDGAPPEADRVKLSDRLQDDIVFADGAFVQAPRASAHRD